MITFNTQPHNYMYNPLLQLLQYKLTLYLVQMHKVVWLDLQLLITEDQQDKLLYRNQDYTQLRVGCEYQLLNQEHV